MHIAIIKLSTDTTKESNALNKHFKIWCKRLIQKYMLLHSYLKFSFKILSFPY